ncbi:hypothetical protein EWB00_008688 [Schistosoma japonicum]|uniref:Uncharacterized protein n=1 Tax=Schistosoma japonicum TaxID=6182 RepID=A0A4Z2CP87_SCHJA|nr:hypothetical protein EWB00_008688 [Schistosoma japonicum]
MKYFTKYDPNSLIHTSNIVYKCDDTCRTKAFLHDNISNDVVNDDYRDTIHDPMEMKNFSLSKINTLNDIDIIKTTSFTTKLPYISYYSCTTPSISTSKYHLHSSQFKWNIINHIQ